MKVLVVNIGDSHVKILDTGQKQSRETVVHKKFRLSASSVIFTLCLSTASTRAQDTNETSAGTRSLAPLPFQLVLPREHRNLKWKNPHGLAPLT
jgi:hypothetical protein